MLDTTIQVKTDHFDGPLGLLLLLVEKEEMNIRELDLTKITKQYLDYLAQMRDLNFDIAGDYLFLAATLLLLKSKVCIAEEEVKNLEGEFGVEGLHITSTSELIRRLEELQLYQKMSKKLWDVEKKGYEVFTKPKVDKKAIINSILTPMDLESLTMTMVDFLFRQRRKYTVVKRDRLSIKEKLKFLKENLKVGDQVTLDVLLEQNGNANREEGAETKAPALHPITGQPKKENIDNIVITFISLLELARLKRVEVFQNEDRSTIYVNVVKSLDDFDVDQANGFDEEEANKMASPDQLKVRAEGENETKDEKDQEVDLATLGPSTSESVDAGTKLIQ